MLSIVRRFPGFVADTVLHPGHFFYRLLQCFLCWGQPKHSETLGDVDVILTQAASDLMNDSPSKTNRRLASFAEAYTHLLGVPIYAQGEVGRILQKRGVPIFKRTLTQSELRIRGLPYLNSRGVAEEQWRDCEQQGWKRILPVAYAPTHIWRVIWVYQKLGFIVRIPRDIPECVLGEDLEQTRNAVKWKHYPFELCSRLFFLYMGWI